MIARILALGTGLVLLAACTSSNPPGATTPAGGTTGAGTPASTSASPAQPPLHEVRARSCPFASEGHVRNTMGIRLGRLSALRSGGRVVGCRFYALQHSPLHSSEHLPGPHQPAVEIVTRRLATALAAHNAFVVLSRKGTNAQQVHFGGTVGVCFQNDFYPKDHGRDWACAASVGRTEIVVRTVDTTGTFGTATLTRAVLRRV